MILRLFVYPMALNFKIKTRRKKNMRRLSKIQQFEQKNADPLMIHPKWRNFKQVQPTPECRPLFSVPVPSWCKGAVHLKTA